MLNYQEGYVVFLLAQGASFSALNFGGLRPMAEPLESPTLPGTPKSEALSYLVMMVHPKLECLHMSACYLNVWRGLLVSPRDLGNPLF